MDKELLDALNDIIKRNEETPEQRYERLTANGKVWYDGMSWDEYRWLNSHILFCEENALTEMLNNGR